MRSAIPRLAAFVAIAAGLAGQAQACLGPRGLNPDDVRIADLVVVGRIVNYEIVPEGRRRPELISLASLSPRARQMLQDQLGYVNRHARFDIVVDEVLAGRSPRIVHAIWDNITSGEPAAAPGGRRLIALHPAIIPGEGDGQSLRPVLQRPCAPAFILANAGDEADAVRRALGAPPASRLVDALASIRAMAAAAALAILGALLAAAARRRRRQP
jgi:hypothetical protein